MTFSSWATLLAGCKKWPGDQSPVEITTEAPVAITDIQEISFQESGSMIPLVSYTTMTRENEGIRVQLELQYQYEYEKMMDASLMDQVQKILETYDVGKWNEFRGNDSMVLDGSSFSFHVTFTDGTSISASGNNAFPKNQRKVFSELNSLIAPVVEQWYQEQYPKMIEDNRINGFSFYVCSKDQAQKFEWRSEKRNDDPQADYLYADIVNIDQFEPIGEVEYFFYGKVPKLPYEELQEKGSTWRNGMGKLILLHQNKRRKALDCSLNTSQANRSWHPGILFPMDMRRRKMRSSHFSGIIFRRIENNL